MQTPQKSSPKLSLSQPKMLRVGVFIERLAHQYHQNIWLGISEMAREHNIHLFTFLYGSLGGIKTPQYALFDFIEADTFDGVIIVKAGEADAVEKKPNWYHRLSQIPSVRIGLPFEHGSYVLAENYNGARLMTEHLITEHHYRKIAFILGPDHHPDVFRRYDAYRAALAAHDIPFQENLVQRGDLVRQSGREAMQKLLDVHGSTLDAVFAGNDEMALGAIDLLWELGYDVPQDIAVVGFDNVQDGAYISSPLTTVKQPMYEMGKTAVSLLSNQIKGQKQVDYVKLDSELVLRQSCGCLPQSVRHVGKATKYLLGLNMPEISPEWQQRLQAAFSNDLQTEDDTQFLQCLNALLRLKSAEDFDADSWQNFLTHLRHQFERMSDTAVHEKRSENIWHQARILVANSNFRSQVTKTRLLTAHTIELSDTVQEITRSFDLEKLFNALVRNLPSLGIHKAAMLLYKQDRRLHKGTIPQSIELVMQFGAGGVTYAEQGLEVKKAYITDNQLISAHIPENVIVQALYQQNKALGCILFFVEPQMDIAFQFELLQSQISNVLLGTLLVRQIQEHAAHLEDEVAKRTDNIKQVNDQLKQYAAELERSHRELEVVAYVSAHDLQEPLRKIRLFADRLSEWAAENIADERGLDYLNRLQRSAARMQLLIFDLQEFSNVITSQHVLERVDLNQVIHHIMQDLAPVIAETRTTITPISLPAIRADRGQMYILFHNLLENGIKFQREGANPVIRLHAEFIGRHEPIYRIFIEDNGIGFDQRFADRIFVAFQQLHGRSQYQGSGIGLAICRRIVERHQGTIYATSQPGQGTTFVIELPAP